MAVSKLAHYSIRAFDLEASRKFYTEVMGFRVGYRPNFPFPGVWLYQSHDEREYGVVHIIGTGAESADERYLGERPANGPAGKGDVDHIAFLATDWPDMRERLLSMQIRYDERTVPTLGLHQVFLQDPSGVTIELNYPSSEGERT